MQNLKRRVRIKQKFARKPGYINVEMVMPKWLRNVLAWFGLLYFDVEYRGDFDDEIKAVD